MKIVKKSQTNEFKNSEKCIAIEYPLADKDISGAIIKLNGRYPEKGKVVNTICKELAYIIKGSGKIDVGDNIQDVNEGDLVLIHPNDEYYWEGDLVMFVPSIPAWYPQQHKEVT